MQCQNFTKQQQQIAINNKGVAGSARAECRPTSEAVIA
jgi:hypothetical protein